MSLSERGVTLVECLVALTLFTLGALGALGTLALSGRMAGEGERASEAARLLAGDLDRLQLAVSLAGGGCPAFLPPPGAGGAGSRIAWRTLPAPGGLGVEFILSYPTVRGQHSDTAQGFVACR